MRAQFDNADNTLVPGLFARVQLGGNDSTQTRAILISDRAIGTDQNRKFVYVVGADSKAEYRAVTLGPSVDGLRVVRDGIKAGEKIIVNGLQRVQPGAPVTAQLVAMDEGKTKSEAGSRAKADPKADLKADTKVAAVLSTGSDAVAPTKE